MSPPVYPSPDVNATGMGNWTDAITKAAKAVSQMTLVEKLSLTVGSPSNTSCSGTIPPIARLGFPGMCLSDASNGLRGTDLVSSFSSGIHVGASWNRALALERATALGNEFKTKGVNVLLGPVVGPLGRVVTGGRLWEGFSIDPYLSGAMVGETVQGIQNVGVVACVKHYIANEQETNRQPENQVAASSSNIDDQTMHEFYLWPFQDAVKAGAGSIMCSYNRLNNSYGCANSQSLNGLLKTELGFKGFVVTDWGAQHAGVATALAGLDMAMPEGYGFWGSELATAVQNGSVPEARITDMATRVMATWYQMHQDVDFPVPGVGMPLNLINPHPIVDGRNKSEQQVLLDSAIEGHVLVKNSGGALPLRSPRMLSIFGYSAKTPDTQRPGDGSVLDSFTYGTESVDSVQFLLQFSGLVSGQYPVIAPNGTIFSGGGSGATAPSNGVSPFEAIKSRARVDGTAVYWDLNSPSPPVDPGSDACLVFGNSWASEGYDRPALRDDFTDGLILAVAGQCNNTIVVLHNAGPRLVDQFIDHPNVTALIFAHLPGQESGPAVAALLYGDANPSGKLPYTVAHNESDYGGLLAPDQPTGIFINFPQSNYSEGSVLDYRRFDLLDIIPRYPFGYGLSYTTFGYTDMSIEFDPAAASAEYPSGLVQPGGQADLFDVLVTASARVTNTGLVAGAEVAQLYISLPSTKLPGVLLKPTGPRLLRGFAKPVLSPAGSAELSFALTRRDLSVWDVTAQRWRLLPGLYRVFVGSSSRNLPLQGNFTI